MTDEQLERGKALKQAIKFLERDLDRVRRSSITLWPGGICDALKLTEPAYSAVRALVVSDLEAQLKALQEEYEAL